MPFRFLGGLFALLKVKADFVFIKVYFYKCKRHEKN